MCILNKLSITLLILSLVSVSACIQLPGGVVATAAQNGIAITDFSSSTDEVTGQNRPVRISMEIENKGGYNTSRILNCIIGLTGATSEGFWNLTSTSPTTNPVAQCLNTTRALAAADPTKGTTGGTTRFSWSLNSPWIFYTGSRTDSFLGRTLYEYQTKASTIVWVYSEAELLAAKQRKESVPSTLTVQQTVGPIAITLNAPQPVKSEDQFFTMKITLSNVGGGTVFDRTDFPWTSTTPPSISVDKLNLISLYISSPSELEQTSCETSVELKKGDTKTVSCDFNLKTSITTRKAYTIRVEATYGYYIDQSLYVKVSGRRDQPTPIS